MYKSNDHRVITWILSCVVVCSFLRSHFTYCFFLRILGFGVFILNIFFEYHWIFISHMCIFLRMMKCLNPILYLSPFFRASAWPSSFVLCWVASQTACSFVHRVVIHPRIISPYPNTWTDVFVSSQAHIYFFIRLHKCDAYSYMLFDFYFMTYYNVLLIL